MSYDTPFSVMTTPIGFQSCVWPAQSAEEAEQLAQKLSASANKETHPNEFWVVQKQDAAATCKFFKGEKFAVEEPIAGFERIPN